MNRPRTLAVLAFAAAAAVLAPGCGRTRQDAALKGEVVGAFRLRLTNHPDPPVVGDNMLRIAVRDGDGRPVGGARVEVIVFMPAMGAMPYMESRGQIRESKPGEYQARYALSMGGEWDVTLRIRPMEGAPIEAAYRVSTSTQGVAFVGGTPPAGSATGSRADTLMAGSEAPLGTITLDEARRQEIGVRFAVVEERELATVVRAPGTVVIDETRQAEVALKFPGWVRELRVDFTGRAVRRGEPLFTVYSPELWSAQVEYLEALRAARSDTSGPRSRFAADLVAAARQRLRLWDLGENQIDAIARAGRPREALPVTSPASGVVTVKNVMAGSPFQAGQVLYRIARLDPIWIVANVHQMDLSHVRLGQSATVLSAGKAVARRGQVSFVYPELDSMTRTGRVRVVVANPVLELKPGMFLQVEIEVPLGRLLAIPESAVIPTGPRNVVFVDLRDGRLAPREVQLGPRSQGHVAVLSGLKAGEQVVASGNFLIAAESRLRSRTW